LAVFGILFIYSSGISSSGVQMSNEYIRQIVWAVLGFIVALALVLVDYRRLYDLSLYFYLGTLALLVYTLFFGRLVNGARAWIGVGPYGIQPSEFAKITTIMFLARYFDSTRRSKNNFVRFAVSCIIVFVPVLLILIQPDFGTALVFIPILLVMAFIAGILIRYIIFLSSCIVLTGVLMVLPLGALGGIAVLVIALAAGITVRSSLRDKAILGVEELNERYESLRLDMNEPSKADEVASFLEELRNFARKHSGYAGARAYDLIAKSHADRKEWSEAEEAWMQAARLSSKNYLAPVAYFNAAVAAEEQGNLQRAVELFSRSADAPDMFPSADRARFSVGRLRETMNDPAAALEAYRAVIEQWPSGTWANLAQSRIIAINAGI
ncbi:FtsW/RodA/SpoVE family cell cycle protein, partial [Treponema sp. OttesenSCG-928-L16]|nr:FtsW/RodA/SpoVE family cell cycle protein [Treponema sp. OttesenSCG-928-L16]